MLNDPSRIYMSNNIELRAHSAQKFQSSESCLSEAYLIQRKVCKLASSCKDLRII